MLFLWALSQIFFTLLYSMEPDTEGHGGGRGVLVRAGKKVFSGGEAVFLHLEIPRRWGREEGKCNTSLQKTEAALGTQ